MNLLQCENVLSMDDDPIVYVCVCVIVMVHDHECTKRAREMPALALKELLW